MPEITIHPVVTLRSEEIDYADFFEKGAWNRVVDLGDKTAVPVPDDKRQTVSEDTLRIVMKDPDEKYEIFGENARSARKALDTANVHVRIYTKDSK